MFSWGRERVHWDEWVKTDQVAGKAKVTVPLTARYFFTNDVKD